MPAYPLLLEPILKPRVWGGRRLARLGKAVPADVRIGESWEVADLPASIEAGRSRVCNGPLAGRTIREILDADPPALLGRAAPAGDGGFPLLVKYLDAEENLSVQVHPTAAYADAHPGAHLKTEAWVVLDAAPGAVIYKGIRPGVDRAAFAHHIEAGSVVDDLIATPARIGDCHVLPSGICHALGAGVLVAEVQTPSDTTFRVFDWNRGRELHIGPALECIDFTQTSTEVAPLSNPMSHLVDGIRTRSLADTAYFAIERLSARTSASLPVVTNEVPVIWMITSGAGVLEGPQGPMELAPGTTVLFPASIPDGTARLHAGAELLRITPPDPLRDVLA